MAVTVTSLSANHAEAASCLVRERLAALRRGAPELPLDWGSLEALAPRIARLAGSAPGAAAFEGKELIGFLGALPIRYAGRSSMLSPEWGNATAPGIGSEAARRVFEALYAKAAEEWTAGAAETHLLCLLGDDAAAFETVSWLGFGRVVCDAVRSLVRVAQTQSGCSVRRAIPGDAGLVRDLDDRLHTHLASSPTLLPHGEPEDVEWWAARLADPRVAIWIAEASRGTVGYFVQGPATDDACDLIVDPGTSSVTGAYVLPEARRGGIATALLARAVDWAREQDYARLSVDFETANVEGVRFWLRHFRPIVVSFARTIRAT